MKILKISKLNKFYDSNKHLEDTEFLNAILDNLHIKFEIRKRTSNAYLKMALTSPYLTIR
jgi:ubiquitin C-terminal hydrolase